MIRQVWFDMGGTLYRETDAFNTVHDALRYKTYAMVVGEKNLDKAKQDYDALYTQYGANSAVFSSLGKPSDFWQTTFDNIDLHSVLIPDPTLSGVLEQLHQLLPVSLFTNFTLRKITETLGFLNIQPAIFTHILSGDDVKKRKPDLEGFRRMVELSNAPADQLLYVGDRVAVDIQPAKAVGMQTCLLWQQSSESDYSALDYTELLHLIRSNRA